MDIIIIIISIYLGYPLLTLLFISFLIKKEKMSNTVLLPPLSRLSSLAKKWKIINIIFFSISVILCGLFSSSVENWSIEGWQGKFIGGDINSEEQVDFFLNTSINLRVAIRVLIGTLSWTIFYFILLLSFLYLKDLFKRLSHSFASEKHSKRLYVFLLWLLFWLYKLLLLWMMFITYFIVNVIAKELIIFFGEF